VLNHVPSKFLDRYRPLKLPPILHSFPPKHYKYLPMFDGENITAEKHIQAFEHFANFFEIEHDEVYMRNFSQSLQGEAKEWFRHLQPESIISWDEMREAFLRFLGERKPWDLLLSYFYAMRRMKDETISSFSRRFASLYYKIPKDIQPPKGTTKLYYATNFHPDLFFLLLERRYVTLQQMFIDSQEVEDNLIACGKLSDELEDEGLNFEECENEHEQEEVDLKLDLFHHENSITDIL
jgi:hypothetical protein